MLDGALGEIPGGIKKNPERDPGRILDGVPGEISIAAPREFAQRFQGFSPVELLVRIQEEIPRIPEVPLQISLKEFLEKDHQEKPHTEFQ